MSLMDSVIMITPHTVNKVNHYYISTGSNNYYGHTLQGGDKVFKLCSGGARVGIVFWFI